MKPEKSYRVVHQGVDGAKRSGEIDSSRVDRIRASASGRRRGYSGGLTRVKRVSLHGRIAWRWTLVIGALTLLALGGVFAGWVVANRDRNRDTSTQDQQAAAERVRKVTAFEPPSREETLAMTRKVLALREPGDVDAIIRRGAMSTEEVIRTLAALPQTDGDLVEESWIGSVDTNGLQLEGVELVFGDPVRPKLRLAFFTPDPRGVWRMDFPAFARPAVPPWERLLADRSITTAVVRVSVVPDNYFNGPFASEDEWESYGLVSLDTETLPVGYCRHGSPQSRTLRRAGERAARPAVRVTLQLSRVEGSDLRQFEISRVLAEDWVLGDLPADEAIGGADPE